MSSSLTKPLLVPEYKNGRVRAYAADAVTGLAASNPRYGVDLQAIVNKLFPGRTAAPNCCALLGQDLFVSNSSGDSQCVFKLPHYLDQPGKAASEAFVFTLDDYGYVGMAFDASGDLFVAQGTFLNNRLFRYTGTSVPYPGPVLSAQNNYGSSKQIGNAGMQSYFANLAFDDAGNLWASDYRNHRVVVFDHANLDTTFTYHVLASCPGPIPVANTNPALAAPAAHLFAAPEGLAFDGNGDLWVANNNDGSGNFTARTSLVRISKSLQSTVLATPSGGTHLPDPGQSNTNYFVYQLPNTADDNGPRPQCGGLQIDVQAKRIYVGEQIAGNGRSYDIPTMSGIGTSTAANDLDIVTTNPGNGGVALVVARPATLSLRDDLADLGVQPNSANPAPWESPDIWTRQAADGTLSGAGSFGQDVAGGAPAHVYARVTNIGLSPSAGTEVLRLHWAKASAGLSVPVPWDGAVPLSGGVISAGAPLPVVAPGQSALVHIPWPATPDPKAYPLGADGHFCLLGYLTEPAAPAFDGFVAGQLVLSVQNLRTAAWRNVHIVGFADVPAPGSPVPLGSVVLANHTSDPMPVHVVFAVLDHQGQPDQTPRGRIRITPGADGQRSFRSHENLEPRGDGSYDLVDIDSGLVGPMLDPGESVAFALAFVPDAELTGVAVRVAQLRGDGEPMLVGGQTFVAGEVRGFTTDPEVA